MGGRLYLHCGRNSRAVERLGEKRGSQSVGEKVGGGFLARVGLEG